MKKILYLLMLCVWTPVLAHGGTLQEDYQEITPLMEMLQTGSGASLNLLEPYIERGNSVAQYLAAAIYDEGRVVSENPQKAAELYCKAADKNPLAALACANMYAQGRGVAPDIDKAEEMYMALAVVEDAQVKQQAQKKLSYLVALRKEEAFVNLLEKKSLQGNAEAQLMLGQYHFNHDNLIGAYVWLSIASDTVQITEKERIEPIITYLKGQMSMLDIAQAEIEIDEIKLLLTQRVSEDEKTS